MAVLECPFCYYIIKVEPPDRLHTAFSSETPIRNSYHGNVMKKKVRCPGCQKSITIFWYAPLEYFTRI